MAYGACSDCGCSREQCECDDRTENEENMQYFICDGTYIRDFECFDIVRKLGVQEALSLLKKSDTQPSGARSASDGSLLFNKGWAVVEVDRDCGLVKAVYNSDGSYSLYQAGIPAFLKRIEQSRLYNSRLSSLYDRLAEPHENA